MDASSRKIWLLEIFEASSQRSALLISYAGPGFQGWATTRAAGAGTLHVLAPNGERLGSIIASGPDVGDRYTATQLDTWMHDRLPVENQPGEEQWLEVEVGRLQHVAYASLNAD